MNKKKTVLSIGAAAALTLTFVAPASAVAGDSRTSELSGSSATCTVNPGAAGGMVVDCDVTDKVNDKYTTRIEWSGPGKSGKDNVLHQGTTAHFTYTFAGAGEFTFKVVEDKGVLPDGVGATQSLNL